MQLSAISHQLSANKIMPQEQEPGANAPWDDLGIRCRL